MCLQYGGFKGVVDRFYRPIAQEYILPVAGWCDVVICKAGVDATGVPQHHLTAIEWHEGRWADHQARMHVKELPALVVGGGQAGLCASYYLQQAGVEHEVIEKHAIGSTWQRERWDSFRLVTENQLCALPGFPCTEIGEDPHGFMARDQVVNYLRKFAEKHLLPVRCGRGVLRITRGWRGWLAQVEPLGTAEASSRTRSDTAAVEWVRTEHIVMAIGGFHEPR